MGYKLVLFKHINVESKYITLIVKPKTLRRKRFSHNHTGSSDEHMLEYTNLFHIPTIILVHYERSIKSMGEMVYPLSILRKIYFSWTLTFLF